MMEPYRRSSKAGGAGTMHTIGTMARTSVILLLLATVSLASPLVRRSHDMHDYEVGETEPVYHSFHKQHGRRVHRASFPHSSIRADDEFDQSDEPLEAPIERYHHHGRGSRARRHTVHHSHLSRHGSSMRDGIHVHRRISSVDSTAENSEGHEEIENEDSQNHGTTEREENQESEGAEHGSEEEHGVEQDGEEDAEEEEEEESENGAEETGHQHSTERNQDSSLEASNQDGIVERTNVTHLSYMMLKIIKQYNIRSVADFPCRNTLDWFPTLLHEVDLNVPGFKYYCVDSEKSSQDDIRPLFSDAGAPHFLHLQPEESNLLPKVDLVFSWGGPQEWGVKRAWGFFKGLRELRPNYVLVSNNPKELNVGSKEGIVNIRKQPFHFAQALRVISNVHEGESPKQLLLYEIDRIRSGF